MTAGYLIKLLQTVDPDSNVSFTVGRTPEERKKYAMAELLDGTILQCVTPHHAEIGLEGRDGVYLDIHLLQDSWKTETLENVETDFKEKYKEL